MMIFRLSSWRIVSLSTFVRDSRLIIRALQDMVLKLPSWPVVRILSRYIGWAELAIAQHVHLLPSCSPPAPAPRRIHASQSSPTYGTGHSVGTGSDFSHLWFPLNRLRICFRTHAPSAPATHVLPHGAAGLRNVRHGSREEIDLLNGSRRGCRVSITSSQGE
jgi:hypothetical protein